MSKKPKPSAITCKAVSVFKINTYITLALELSIVDGEVVSVKQLNPSDLPTRSIGAAQKSLWSQLETQTISEDVKL